MPQKKLTKQMLIDYGISVIQDADGVYHVMRTWYVKNSHNNIKTYEIVPRRTIVKHKFSKDKSYVLYTFHYCSKSMSLTAQKLFYAWFYGEVPEGYDVDHIDNDPFNNRIDNLQLLSRQENIIKTYIDRPNRLKNQHDAEREISKCSIPVTVEECITSSGNPNPSCKR